MSNEHPYCRLCLCKLEDSTGIPILGSGDFFTEQTLLETINSVFPFKVNESDGYSKVICTFCDSRVADIWDYMETVVGNQEELKRRLVPDNADIGSFDFSLKEEYEAEEFLEDDDFIEEEEKVKVKKKKPKVRSADTIKGEPIECDICGEKFRSKGKAEEHMFLHMSDAKPEIQCFECGDKFFTSKQMRRHYSQTHPRRGTVKVSNFCLP